MFPLRWLFGPLLQSFSVGGRQTAIGISDKPKVICYRADQKENIVFGYGRFTNKETHVSFYKELLYKELEAEKG